jgi:hypothetical protein
MQGTESEKANTVEVLAFSELVDFWLRSTSSLKLSLLRLSSFCLGWKLRPVRALISKILK